MLGERGRSGWSWWSGRTGPTTILETGVTHRRRRGRGAPLATTTPCSSARSAIRACRRTSTRATSSSGCASGSTSTSTCAPCASSTSALTPLKGKTEKDIDFVIFRENTEGVYVGMGGCFKRGTPDEVAIQEDVNTRKGVERIIRAAFEHARAHRPRSA